MLILKQGCDYPPAIWHRYEQVVCMNDCGAKSPCASKLDQRSLHFLAALSALREAKISFMIARVSKQQVPIPLMATFSKAAIII